MTCIVLMPSFFETWWGKGKPWSMHQLLWFFLHIFRIKFSKNIKCFLITISYLGFTFPGHHSQLTKAPCHPPGLTQWEEKTWSSNSLQPTKPSSTETPSQGPRYRLHLLERERIELNTQANKQILNLRVLHYAVILHHLLTSKNITLFIIFSMNTSFLPLSNLGPLDAKRWQSGDESS